MKAYRVRHWLEDGSEEFWECDTMPQAIEFYDSQNGLAELQQYNERRHEYEAVIYPEFEY